MFTAEMGLHSTFSQNRAYSAHPVFTAEMACTSAEVHTSQNRLYTAPTAFTAEMACTSAEVQAKIGLTVHRGISYKTTPIF